MADRKCCKSGTDPVGMYRKYHQSVRIIVCFNSSRCAVCDLKLLVFSAIRLLVIPYIIMQIVFRITEDTMMQTVLFVVMVTPAGSMVSMLAQQYDKKYLTASKVIAVTTVLSVVTMPVLSVLLKI